MYTKPVDNQSPGFKNQDFLSYTYSQTLVTTE